MKTLQEGTLEELHTYYSLGNRTLEITDYKEVQQVLDTFYSLCTKDSCSLPCQFHRFFKHYRQDKDMLVKLIEAKEKELKDGNLQDN